MPYFQIPVNITVDATDLDEAQMRAYFFMPWTTDGVKWSTKQHKHINGWQIDGWQMEGVDTDKMEAELREWGMR